VAVHCPKEFTHIVQRAGGVWMTGSRRWLIERRRNGSMRSPRVIPQRALHMVADVGVMRIQPVVGAPAPQHRQQ